MATFQIPFGFAEEWHSTEREPIHIEQARALQREAEGRKALALSANEDCTSRVTVALSPALSRSVAEAAAIEGLTVSDWLVRVAARTVFNNPTAA